MSKTIPQLSTVPGGVLAANLFFEVARQITAGNFNGESEKISGDALLALLAGTSLTLNIIQRLNPTGAAYDPVTTYTLYDFLDVAYQGGHYAYIGVAPSSGNAPTDSAYWLLISEDGAEGLTQAQADLRYPLKTDTDPYPFYLTQAEAAALFSPIGGDAQGGLRYTLSLATTSPPLTGQVRFNNAAIASVTQIFIHESDRNSAAQSEILDAIALGTRLQVALESNEEIYAWFRVSGAVVDNGSDRTIPVAFVSSSGTFAAGEVTVDFLQIQGTANSGGGASGLQYTYSTTAGAGVISATNLTTATTLAINATDATPGGGENAATVLGRLKNGAIFQLTKDPSNYVRYLATGDYASGSVAVSVDVVAGAILANDTVYLAIVSDAPATVSSQSDTVFEIPFSATIIPNLNQGNVFKLTATNNFELSEPQNTVLGKEWDLYVTQDATGSRILSLSANTAYEPEGGSLTLSTTPNRYDILRFRHFGNHSSGSAPRISAYFAAKNLAKGSAPPLPVITSVLTATATTGTAFAYMITATNTPTSYGATPLPAGLTINPATGAISGTPTAAGVTNISISATNGGGSDTETLILTVEASVRPSAKNTLTYTPTDGQVGQTYSGTNTLNKINDGVLTSGAYKNSNSPSRELWVLATFTAATFINEIAVTNGTFQGRYNEAVKVFIYRGTTTATPLLNPVANNLDVGFDGGTPLLTTTIDLLSNTAFNTPSSEYLFVFRLDTSATDLRVGIAELVIKGVTA